jgi:hypothetical protein
VPPPTVAGSETELEQQREPGVVSVPVAVVEGLRVVGIRAGPEQQPSERQLIRVGRRVAVASAERSSERGERRAEPLPQVARIRIGAVVEQDTSRLERVVSRSGGTKPGVCEVQERLPGVRTALPIGRRRIAVEPVAGSGRVSDGCDRVNRRRRELGISCEQLPRPRPPPRVVVTVVQARQSEELVDERLSIADRLADGLGGRRARIALRELEIRLQRRPARKAVRPSDHELRVGALQRFAFV